MDTVNIKINNKLLKTYPKNTLYYDISKDCGIDNIVAYRFNNAIYSLDSKALNDAEVEFINYSDVEGNRIYKNGLKFLLQVALEEIIPNAQIEFKHGVPKGILGKIVCNRTIDQEDIDNIKARMRQIIGDDEKITKISVQSKEAIRFYDKVNEEEKAQNISQQSAKIVTLYKLRGRLNYFYSGMPYSVKSLDKFNIINLGNNEIVLMFPEVYSNGTVPEYIHNDKITESFFEGSKWLEKIKVPYINNLNSIISDGKIADFIRSCELMFSMELFKTCENIVQNKDIKFVLIAGPSSSGKTTTTSKLGSYFEALGYNTINISLDDYFVDKEKTPKDENGEYNFECLGALNVKLFNQNLKDLLEGKEVIPPQYNFILGKSEVSNRKLKLQDNTVLLIEGLHAINDELTKEIEPKYKYKIYLSPFIPLKLDKHNYISTLDLRLLRRMVRDYRTRGHSVEETINIWKSVRNGEEKYIFPFIHRVDKIVNTALAYEVGVLKVYVEPLLLSVPSTSIYYEEARRLIDFLKVFYPIPSECVNNDSILREFIGGINND